jgi:hypothetical protein
MVGRVGVDDLAKHGLRSFGCIIGIGCISTYYRIVIIILNTFKCEARQRTRFLGRNTGRKPPSRASRNSPPHSSEPDAEHFFLWLRNHRILIRK